MRRTFLPIEDLSKWALENDVQLNGCTVDKAPSGLGYGVIATASTSRFKHPFIIVPSQLILNRERVWICAETDSDLKEVLEANGAFAKVMQQVRNLKDTC